MRVARLQHAVQRPADDAPAPSASPVHNSQANAAVLTPGCVTLRACLWLALSVALSVGTSLVLVIRAQRGMGQRPSALRDAQLEAECEPCPTCSTAPRPPLLLARLSPPPQSPLVPSPSAPARELLALTPTWWSATAPPGRARFGRVAFVAYANHNFTRSLKRVVREAKRYDVFTSVRGYKPVDLDADWRAQNAALLSKPRGGGFWAWKSHIIYRALLAARDGDIVFYMDAGSTIRSDPRPLVELASMYGAVAFRVDLPQHDWAKGEIFAALGMPMEIWGPQPQITAGLLVLQRRPETLAIVREWAALSTNASLIDDSAVIGGAPNHKSFVENRHDQAIWSMLCYKHGLQIVLKGGSLRRIVHHTRVHG